jgi:hypothetical protein
VTAENKFFHLFVFFTDPKHKTNGMTQSVAVSARESCDLRLMVRLA